MKKLKENWSYLFVGMFLITTMIYIIIRGEGIYLQAHDYLDSHPAWINLIKENKLFWSIDTELPLLGGASRNYFYSDIKAYTWLFMIFPTFCAIIIGWYIKILLAIIGFVFLSHVIYGGEMKQKNLFVMSGFLYGILPTYPPAAFAFATLPMLLGLLILIYRKSNWKLVLATFLYPLFSEFFVFGIFICGYMVMFLIFDWITKKKLVWRMLLPLFALAIGYIITEWRMFYAMLFSTEESIRTTYVYTYYDASDCFGSMWNVFVNGYYHCGSLHKYIVLPVCLIYLIYINIGYLKSHSVKQIVNDKFNWLMTWIVFNCVVYGLDNVEIFRECIVLIIPPLNGFSFARTIWFNPFLWYLSFMIVLYRLNMTWLKNTLLFLSFCVICLKDETYNHIRNNLIAATCSVISKEYDGMSYGDFYSEELFEQIKKDIDYNGEWSIAFGMHPAVIEYNNIATLDGYLSTYSLEYKEQFRKLIAPELEMDEENADYFDMWGGRAYIFSDEVAFQPARSLERDEANININPEVFRDMGGKYIFSRVSMINMNELGFSERGIYTDESSPYTIYVYEINE